MTDEAVIATADETARRWASPDRGIIRPGSEEHKNAFCRMLLDTHNPYKPTVIDWPPLDTEARDRLVALPIWDIAVQTEGKARIRVLSYAEETPDPLLRRAVRDLLIGYFRDRMHTCWIERSVSQLVGPQIGNRNVAGQSQSGELVCLDLPG